MLWEWPPLLSRVANYKPLRSRRTIKISVNHRVSNLFVWFWGVWQSPHSNILQNNNNALCDEPIQCGIHWDCVCKSCFITWLLYCFYIAESLGIAHDHRTPKSVWTILQDAQPLFQLKFLSLGSKSEVSTNYCLTTQLTWHDAETSPCSVVLCIKFPSQSVDSTALHYQQPIRAAAFNSDLYHQWHCVVDVL